MSDGTEAAKRLEDYICAKHGAGTRDKCTFECTYVAGSQSPINDDARFAAAIRAIAEEHKNCPVLQLRETEDCSILDDIMNAHHEIYGTVLCPVKESP